MRRHDGCALSDRCQRPHRPRHGHAACDRGCARACGGGPSGVSPGSFDDSARRWERQTGAATERALRQLPRRADVAIRGAREATDQLLCAAALHPGSTGDCHLARSQGPGDRQCRVAAARYPRWRRRRSCRRLRRSSTATPAAICSAGPRRRQRHGAEKIKTSSRCIRRSHCQRDCTGHRHHRGDDWTKRDRDRCARVALDFAPRSRWCHAVRQWEFTPTLINGVPVAIIMSVTVNFQLRRRRRPRTERCRSRRSNRISALG